MDSSNFQWWLVSIAVGAIGAFIWMRSRRASNPDIDSAFLESRQAPDFAPTRVAARRTGSTVRSEPADGASSLFDDMRDDPVAGASILSQSGRSKEAEQVLIRASLADPERNDTLLALLDLYIAQRDEKGVTGVMCLLKTKTTADSTERARATRAFEKSGIRWSADMQRKFDNLVEKASSEA
jgi:hypothetical protein